MEPTSNPGVMTSEFWTKNLIQALMIVGALTHHGVDEKTATIVVGGLETLYMGGRTVIKALKAYHCGS